MDFISSYIPQIIILVTAVVFALHKVFTRNFDYWEKKNVPYVKPLPLVGNFLDVFTLRSTIGHLLAKMYKEFQTPYFGIYILNKPHLIIKSPDLIKLIFVKDFNQFADRNIVSDEKCDSMVSKMLFVVKNPEWKAIRGRMTPVFTTGKIKNMVGLINAAAEEMIIYVNRNISKNFIEAKEMCSKYSTEVVASCAFGISANCFKYENAEFRELGRKIYDFHWKTAIRLILYFIAPDVVKFFKIRCFERSITDFMRDVFWKTVEEREKTGQKRHDLIDVIIQMKKEAVSNDSMKFEGDTVVAQAGQFFAAGFESTSTTISFTLYELCLHPEIQNKLRSEVKTVFSQHGGFTYEAIQDMKYLHMVICETLRKYPSLPFLDRMCIEDYKVPNSNLIIEKGTPVFIPTFGLHYDPKYFPEPEKYDPERFSDDKKRTIPGFTFMPFGEGPRNCIGERFGSLAAKLAVARIISEFELEACAETPVPLKYETKSTVLASTVGLPMKFQPLVSKAPHFEFLTE